MSIEEKKDKKCSRCKSYRYPIEFFNNKGRELKSCDFCRERDKIYREKRKRREVEEREEIDRDREDRRVREEIYRNIREERERIDRIERIEKLDQIESKLFNDPYERIIVRDLLRQLRRDRTPDFII
tara:strand:- start:1047 stop:1427 length:381 start_codon:yes stop_codon:yes gene_type:complete